MALRALATGGVYLCGGITPKLLPRIVQTGGVREAFLWPASRFNKASAWLGSAHFVSTGGPAAVGGRSSRTDVGSARLNTPHPAPPAPLPLPAAAHHAPVRGDA